MRLQQLCLQCPKLGIFKWDWRLQNLISYAPANCSAIHWSVANSQPFCAFLHCAFPYEISAAMSFIEQLANAQPTNAGSSGLFQLFQTHVGGNFSYAWLPTRTSGWSEINEMYTRRPLWSFLHCAFSYESINFLPGRGVVMILLRS